PIFDPMLGEGLSMGSVMGQLMIAVLFAFEGWTNVGAIAGEMKNPGKDLPKAIVGGVALIMAVYVIINLAYLWVLPADVMMNLESPASAVAMEIFGDMGGKFVSVGIMISAGGACNGFILSGSRTALYMAEQGDLPCSKALAKISKNGVPANCIYLIGVLGAIYALSGQFDLLTNLGTFVGWVFYTLTFAAVMAYRKQAPDVERTYKVPLYPVIPIISIASGCYVLINQLFMCGMGTTMIAVGGIVLVLIGLPVRAIFCKKK
ncbi:MAG: amino acid permease, partial [Anaerotignum sp.]|nr:amino acid permease [Anaerotignum sp.]